jgi:hypothetical protein
VVKKIISIRLNEKRVISELLVATSTSKEWILKKDALALAECGLLNAIVIHAKRTTYLRPKFHQTPFRQLGCPAG